MRTTTIGSSDLEVSAIGFGAMHLSLAGRPAEDEAIEVLHRAFDLGVTLIDTADSYCRDDDDFHHNERLIRGALDTYPGDVSAVTVATKGGSVRPGGAWVRDSDPDRLRETIRVSSEILGQPIALWQHHAPDPDRPVEEALEPVREAVKQGLVRHVGVSNYSVEQIERARAVVPIVSVQNRYNPWHRQPERDGTLAYCEREGLTFIPYSPLGGSGRAGDAGSNEALAAIAEERGVSPQRVVLAWLLARSDAILPIPGASRVETLEDSIRAVEVDLTDDEVRRIDEAV